MKKLFAVTTAVVLLCLGNIAQATITIETVRVGDAGNAADTSSNSGNPAGQGSVAYNYNIGKYEVTSGQYAAFLNVKANVSDIYALYDTNSTYMANTSYGSGITRNGSSGSYSYTVDAAFVNRPVSVSYWDACRFVNWLSNGQGSGSTETGAYTLGGYTGRDGRLIQRNAGATWAVTSEDEWYKAAYYKGGGSNAGYWLYPTQSNSTPGRDLNDASGNNANYLGSGSYPIDSGKYTTVVGEFQKSASAYGTFDQGGNVDEWNESIVVPDVNYATRGRRGGDAREGGSLLRSSYRGSFGGYPSMASSGFRVVQLSPVPEPSSIIALLGGLVGLFGSITRRRII